MDAVHIDVYVSMIRCVNGLCTQGHRLDGCSTYGYRRLCVHDTVCKRSVYTGTQT